MPSIHPKVTHRTRRTKAGRLTRSDASPHQNTMLGAGSAFTPRLLNDVLRIPGEQGGTIALVDIDRSGLDTMAKLLPKLIKRLGKRNWKVLASHDRRKVMTDSDYLVTASRSAARPACASTTTSPLGMALTVHRRHDRSGRVGSNRCGRSPCGSRC